MSLEHSQHTFFSLQEAPQSEFKKEVDRITKEADHVDSDDEERNGPSSSKRLRLSQQEDRGISGTIIEVTLEDFLCHSHMHIELNSDINFIVGQNGSGKSAILTALVVALGGNASTTGRGASLKDFVKHGRPSAKVTCVINNAGWMSFKKEEYGERITIVRTILAAGGGNIKIKSERGRVISSKMEDLKHLTLGLGIQVDNPISVLDQNTARHFLNQSKPSAKFELFMRATNLETLQQMYLKIAGYVSNITHEINKKERHLTENNRDVEEARRKYLMFANLEKDRLKSNHLKMELLWAQARDHRICFERAQQSLLKAQSEKDRLTKMLSSTEEQEPFLQQIESAKSDIRALESEKREVDNEVKAMRLQYQAANAKQKKIIQEKQSILTKLKQDEKTIEEYKAEIRSQEEKTNPEHVEMRRRQRDQIQELHGLLQQYKKEREAKKLELSSLDNSMNQLQESLNQSRRSFRYHEEEKRKAVGQLQDLETSESNLALFAPFMPQLVQQIESNQNRFKKKPVGPLGAYVKVKDSKWTLAVECAIRSRLNTFVVDNVEDEKLLHSIMDRVAGRGRKPGVVRVPFPTRPFDTSRSAVQCENYQSILDVVEISNMVARNLLIDLCRVDGVLLIPTDDECFNVLSDQRNVPRNCRQAYTLKADQYFPAPGYKTYGSTTKAAKVLQTSRDQIIRDMKQRILELQETSKSEAENVAKVNREIDLLKAQGKRINTDIATLNQKIVQTTNKYEQLKDVEQPDVNAISNLREELANLERELQANKDQLDDFPAKVELFKKEKEELQAKGTVLTNKIKDLDKKIETLEAKQQSCQEQLDELKSAQAGKKRKLEQATKQEEQFSKESEESKAKFEEHKLEAEKYETFVQSEFMEKKKEFVRAADTKRSLKTIDQELRLLLKRLAAVEKTLGQNAESTEEEFLTKFAAFNTTKKYINLLKNNAAFLKHALQCRKSLYHTQKSLMCAVVSHQFTRVLKYRNCTGSVKVSFDKKELTITVGPIDEGERTGLGTSSLSGGERSYATMAFVIALWNVTELPFYFLDEFDVFMDRLNRQTVLTLLLRFAKQKKGYQFGFLTPQDTTVIKSSDRVSIFKLDAPRRE